MQPIEFKDAYLRLISALIILYIAMFAILTFSKISLEPTQTLATYATICFPTALAVYARWRRMDRLYGFFDTFIACLLATVPLTVLSYFAMSFNRPLADAWLMSADIALGFDWRQTVAFVDRFPLASSILNLAYATFSYQLICLPLWLSLTGKKTEAAALIFAFVVFCALLSLCAIPFPALGAFAYLSIQPDTFPNLDPTYGYLFLPEFHAVREQVEFTIQLKSAAGILTFPSGHAGAALLLAWIGWRSRTLRFPLVALNLAMGFSSITNGGHYLTDVIAGLALASLTIAVTRLMFFRAVAHGRQRVDPIAGPPIIETRRARRFAPSSEMLERT